MKFENVVEINAPVDEVFKFVADMRNTPKWNYYVTRVVQESGNGPALGARYRQTRKTDEQRYKISQYDPGCSLIVETLPGSSPEFKRYMRFEIMAEGTRLIDQWSLRTGYPALLENLAGGRVRKAVAENLGKLKELLERGQTQLQDGRMVLYSSSYGNR